MHAYLRRNFDGDEKPKQILFRGIALHIFKDDIVKIPNIIEIGYNVQDADHTGTRHLTTSLIWPQSLTAMR